MVFTKPQEERKAKAHLEKLCEVFFPLLRIENPTKRQKPFAPLFKRYLFVHLTPDQFNNVRWTPGVNSLITDGEGNPIPISEERVNILRQKADERGIIAVPSRFKQGDRVHIESGPFAGFEGIVENPPGPSERVKILMEVLGRKVTMEVPLKNLQEK